MSIDDAVMWIETAIVAVAVWYGVREQEKASRE